MTFARHQLTDNEDFRNRQFFTRDRLRPQYARRGNRKALWLTAEISGKDLRRMRAGDDQILRTFQVCAFCPQERGCTFARNPGFLGERVMCDRKIRRAQPGKLFRRHRAGQKPVEDD